MMTFTTNNTPAGRDMRHVHPTAAERMYQPVRNTTTPAPAPAPAPQADPIRDAVLAKLKEAGIHTDGKTDSALLADYTKLLRDESAEQQPAKAEKQAQNAAHNEFAGCSINSLIEEGSK